MGTEVSVIIPSYNRYPLNLLALDSLAIQTFDPSKMEVIFIDDGSTDETKNILKMYYPPFSFQYIRTSNKGRSKARNLGIKKAKGKIIIFLDAEMIVNPDFVEKHYTYHQTHPNGVLTGELGFHTLYSFAFPELNSNQLAQLEDLINQSPIYMKKFNTFIETRRPVQLIDKNDLHSQAFRKLSFFSQSELDKKTIELFGEDLKQFQTPWMAFVTANVSVRKSLLQLSGYFDESFRGWGFEDWELGFRLYQYGATFAYRRDIAGYHQEHPISNDSNWESSLTNFWLFQKKHKSIDVLAIVFILLGLYDRLDVHYILKEFKTLKVKYPNQFSSYRYSIRALLNTALDLMKDGEPVKNLTTLSGLDQQLQTILTEQDTIKTLEAYPNLVKAFDHLISL
ncbi:glycosyltransferase family 2 protein [Terrilactibacillus laevilacticus]|uniref:glycosyltransferase family 2 protein n=1 Tax=Terrilactibacillus laevilacticus TaxID=1380157 RepID=UPI0011472DBE|nr:glycosyltransferase [Terrilactibacillus laevilacticus]